MSYGRPVRCHISSCESFTLVPRPDVPPVMYPLPIFAHLALIAYRLPPRVVLCRRLFAVYGHTLGVARVQARRPRRRQTLAHMPLTRSMTSLLSLARLIVVLLAISCTGFAPGAFAVHPSRLFQVQLRFFKLHQLGHEADVGRYPLSTFRDVGVSRFQRPRVGVDQVRQDDCDRPGFARLAVDICGC